MHMRCGAHATKAYLAIEMMTSLNLIAEVIVRPCFTSGSPSVPSQQSISRHRQPCCSCTSYIRVSELEANWSPTRYELCDDAQ